MIPMKPIKEKTPPISEAFDNSISNCVCISMFKGMPGGTDSKEAAVEDLLEAADLLVAVGEDPLAAVEADRWVSVGLEVEWG